MKILYILGTFIFTLVGVGLIWYGVSSYRQYQAALSWPTVMGKVTTSKVIVETDPDGDPCYIGEIEYLYLVQNKEYQNDDAIIGAADCAESAANELVQKYPPQAEVKVFYDPNQPEVSGLEPGTGGAFLLIIIVGVIWTAITGLALVGLLIRSKR